MKTDDPYKNSTVLAKLRKRKHQNLPLRLAFLDIDSTMTLERPADATNQIRALLEEKEFVVSFVTSKTEEIIITEDQRKKSSHFTRPAPHFAKNAQGKLIYIDSKKVEPQGVLDADLVIGSTGSNIAVKQQSGGYMIDESYRDRFVLDPDSWRKKLLSVIKTTITHTKTGQLNAIEFAENYNQGLTDVFPPDYRVQVTFESIQKIKQFIAEFKKQNSIPIHITDDSDPENTFFCLYIKPPHTSKRHAVDHVINCISKNLSQPVKDLHLLFAGDSYPDLLMGAYGAKDADATFLIVGKSRLTSYLIDKNKNEFAGIDISEIKRHLHPEKEGLYSLRLPDNLNRKVIIGDIVFPGTIGPETILAYLKQQK